MRGSTLVALYEVIQKFGYRGDTAHQQMIPSAGTGHVEQVPLGVIDFLQVSVITDRLNALLQGNYFVIAGHHHHGPKLQTFGEVHGADRDVPTCGFDVFIENLERKNCFLYSSARTIQLCCRPDEHAQLVRYHSGLGALSDPIGDQPSLFALALDGVNRWRRTVEDRDRIAPIFGVAIHVGHDWAKKPIRLRSDLMGGAVIDAQGARTSPDIDAQGLP
jgi:hypothetical protein